MAKLLVTGGAGFIGSNFIRYWLREHPEDSVVNLDALTYAGNLANLADVADDERYRFVQGDVTDGLTVGKLVADADTVVHFAAETHNDRGIMAPTKFLMTNAVGTQTLLNAAVEHGVERFHHISTDEVFGHLPSGTDEKFSERTPFAPRSPYSASKAAADHLVHAYHITYGLPTTITNCSNNFGPYMYPEKFIPLAVTNVLEGKKIPIYGDGSQVRDWLYVDDHCRAIDLVLQKGRVGETYCIGGQTEAVTNLEVARLLLAELGRDESMLEFVKDRPGHDQVYAVDWNKARDELGYRPEHPFEENLKKTVRWYADHREYWQEARAKSERFFEKQYGRA